MLQRTEMSRLTDQLAPDWSGGYKTMKTVQQ